MAAYVKWHHWRIAPRFPPVASIVEDSEFAILSALSDNGLNFERMPEIPVNSRDFPC